MTEESDRFPLASARNEASKPWHHGLLWRLFRREEKVLEHIIHHGHSPSVPGATYVPR